MALLEEAKRVAAEFEYPTESLFLGIQVFIDQMRRFNGILRTPVETKAELSGYRRGSAKDRKFNESNTYIRYSSTKWHRKGKKPWAFYEKSRTDSRELGIVLSS